MKKINLKGISEIMSETELRNTTGGGPPVSTPTFTNHSPSKDLIMKTKYLIISLLVIFPISVWALPPDSLMSIDLVNPKIEEIPTDRLFSNIEYIPLESTDACKLDVRFANYYLTKEYIIAINNFNGAFLFDRITGKFIRQISKEGSGENEYRRFPLFCFGFDENKNILFFDDINQWKGISTLSNKTEVKITKPEGVRTISLPNKEVESSSEKPVSSLPNKNVNDRRDKECIFNPWPIGNGKYIGFVNNTTGDIDTKLSIFNERGEVIQRFPNYQTYLKKPLLDHPTFPGQFYTYNHTTYFKEYIYNDTVYAITPKVLKPHIVFNLGDKRIPYEEMDNENFKVGRYQISLVRETDRFVFFVYEWWQNSNPQSGIPFCGYYDKQIKETYVCTLNDNRAGFKNKNGLPDFVPRIINNKAEFLGIIKPEDVLKYQNSIDKTKLDPILSNCLYQIKQGDNPIVVIMHLK